MEHEWDNTMDSVACKNCHYCPWAHCDYSLGYGREWSECPEVMGPHNRKEEQ